MQQHLILLALESTIISIYSISTVFQKHAKVQNMMRIECGILQAGILQASGLFIYGPYCLQQITTSK